MARRLAEKPGPYGQHGAWVFFKGLSDDPDPGDCSLQDLDVFQFFHTI